MDTQTPNAKAGTQKDVYGIINERIIEQLNKGTIPWQRPWNTGRIPRNMITGRQYRGINLMLLAMEDYEHNLFITFQQLGEIKAKVKKGEKGHMVVYWNRKPKEEALEAETEPGAQKPKTVLRYYYVFNVTQCENIPEKYLPAARETAEQPSCESIIRAMPHCPPIRHKEQSAFYNVKEDFVNMPKKRSFKTDDAYYSTLFHELVHSTGHESRLNRKTIAEMAEFGGEAYSQEELIAEIGTCYLQSHAGITSQFQQSAAYIYGWLRKLKNDKRFVFFAASAAQKAADFILNVKTEQEETEETEE